MSKSSRNPTIHHGDCIEVMRAMPENSIDSIVTDPPYGLGYFGMKWDALLPGEDWARECLRVLKPGGHILAFGGSRTWHRLAVAIDWGNHGDYDGWYAEDHELKPESWVRITQPATAGISLPEAKED